MFLAYSCCNSDLLKPVQLTLAGRWVEHNQRTRYLQTQRGLGHGDHHSFLVEYELLLDILLKALAD